VLGVWLGRFDHQVEFTGAADLARHTLGLARHEAGGLGGVIQLIDAPGVAVEQLQHRTPPVLIPREKEQMIGAEVECGGTKATGVGFTPRPMGSAVEGFVPGLTRDLQK